MIVIWRDLHQINPHHVMRPREGLQHLYHFIIQEPAVAWRAGARCDGRAKAVDVDGDIDPRARRNARYR